MPEVKQESKTLKDQWEEDGLIRNGAAIAMFSILSFAPLIALLTLALRAFGLESLGTQFAEQLGSIIGQGSAEAFSNALNSSAGGGWSVGIISILSLLTAVYAVARQLRDVLNEVFDVDRDEPLEDELKRNLQALAMVLLVGVVMFVVIALTATVGALGSLVEDLGTGTQIFAQVGNLIGVALLVAFLFGLIYKTVPDADMEWKDLTTGTLLAGALFAVGTAIVTWYINSSAGVQSSMNVFGSTIVLMIWALYISVVMLFGAELVQHNARRNGRIIQPDY